MDDRHEKTKETAIEADFHGNGYSQSQVRQMLGKPNLTNEEYSKLVDYALHALRNNKDETINLFNRLYLDAPSRVKLKPEVEAPLSEKLTKEDLAKIKKMLDSSELSDFNIKQSYAEFIKSVRPKCLTDVEINKAMATGKTSEEGTRPVQQTTPERTQPVKQATQPPVKQTAPTGGSKKPFGGIALPGMAVDDKGQGHKQPENFTTPKRGGKS